MFVTKDIDWNAILYGEQSPEESLELIDKVIRGVEKSKIVAFDFETGKPGDKDDGVNPLKDIMLSVSFCCDGLESYAIRLEMNDSMFSKQSPEVLDKIKDLFNFLLDRKDIKKIIHSLKFDAKLVYRLTGRYPDVNDPSWLDTLVMAHLSDETKTAGLKKTASRLLNIDGNKYERRISEHGKVSKMAGMDWVIVSQYNAADSLMTWRLFEVLDKDLKSQGLDKLYYNLCQPFVLVLLETELVGFQLDVDYLRDKKNDIGIQVEDLIKEMKKASGSSEFNPRSVPQMRNVIHKLGLSAYIPDDKRGGKTGVSTDYETLTSLSTMDSSGFIKSVLDFRDKDKRRTFVEGLLERVDQDGVVRTNFLVHGTKTGRLSSSDPNLQNLEQGRYIRGAFVARPGRSLVIYDYSQLELRLAAYYSQDPVMLDVFARNGDIHSRTAIIAYDLKCMEEEVSKLHKDSRSKSKCVHPSSLLWDSNGYPFKIGSLDFGKVDEFTPCGRSILGRSGNVSIMETYNGGEKKLLHIVSRGGILTCSENHLVETNRGLIRAELVRNGDRVVEGVIPNLPESGDVGRFIEVKLDVDTPPAYIKVSNELAYISGLYLGDGCLSSHAVSMAHGDIEKTDAYGFKYSEWRETVCKCFENVGMKPRKTNSRKTIYLGSRSLMRFFEGLELITGDMNRGKRGLEVPSWILSGGMEMFKHFLAGIIDTDGDINKFGDASFLSKSPIFIGQIVCLCRACGMTPRIEACWNKIYQRMCYRVHLLVNDTTKLKKYMKHPGKISRIHDEISTRIKCNCLPSNEVIAIVPGGICKCVDLHIDSDDHLYVCNGFITHNSINFGILYDMYPKSLSKLLKCEYKEAEIVMDRVFGKYKVLNEYKKLIKKEAVDKEYVTNIFGRRRRFPGIRDMYRRLGERDREVSYMLREIFNFLIQSTGADICNLAITYVKKRSIEEGIGALLLAQIHDEMIWEVADSNVDRIKKIIEEEAETILDGYKLPIEGTIVKRWGDKYPAKEGEYGFITK